MTIATKNVNKPGLELKDIFVEFVKWSVMTKKERQEVRLSTARLFAKKYNLHESQLSRWKHHADFQRYKEQYQREKLQELTPEVLDAFFRRCMRYGMSSDIELWLALVERWDKKKVIEYKPPVTLDPSDIRMLIKNLPPEKQKMFYDNITRLLADARQAEQSEKEASFGL